MVAGEHDGHRSGLHDSVQPVATRSGKQNVAGINVEMCFQRALSLQHSVLDSRFHPSLRIMLVMKSDPGCRQHS